MIVSRLTCLTLLLSAVLDASSRTRADDTGAPLDFRFRLGPQPPGGVIGYLGYRGLYSASLSRALKGRWHPLVASRADTRANTKS